MEDYIDLVVFLNKNVTTLNEEKAKYKLDKKINQRIAKNIINMIRYLDKH